jgi:hypothetical protein
MDGTGFNYQDLQPLAEMGFACQPDQFPANGAMMQRAPALIDSLVDGTAVNPSPEQQVPLLDFDVGQLDMLLSGSAGPGPSLHASIPILAGDSGICVTPEQYSTRRGGITM